SCSSGAVSAHCRIRYAPSPLGRSARPTVKASMVSSTVTRATVSKSGEGTARLCRLWLCIPVARDQLALAAGLKSGVAGIVLRVNAITPGSEERMRYSLLDVAAVGHGERPADALHGAVPLAQAAGRHGYHRVWYAEHHNMPQIASAATSVLIAHVAAHTSRIRLGAGGVMLPNHAPLVIAEQFGTLAELHPGRIDLGLGRAPGSDQNTMRALRRTAQSAESFPQDVLELQGYLSGRTLVQGVRATPGDGTSVPLYILGSSLFGAQLAAALGLPYAFASHFAPAALEAAAATYRAEYKPSAQHPEPYLIVAANLIAADSAQEAEAQYEAALRWRA